MQLFIKTKKIMENGMKVIRSLQWVWLMLIASLLSGCGEPTADFTITPTQLTVGIVGSFDASTSAAYGEAKGNSIVSYEWIFGDGATGNGKIVTHTYDKAGEYKVQLKVTDMRGVSKTKRKQVTVTAPINKNAISVQVRSTQGALLSNAEVTIDGLSVETNAQGIAELENIASGTQVITASKSGFITQSTQVELSANSQTSYLLIVQPIKEEIALSNITQSQLITSQYQQARITLPESALVDSKGVPAIGSATLKLTPWDITGDDLTAMPGNGKAKTTDGDIVELVSAGMMTIDFYDLTGNHLQLATGKKATIQMDLPYASIAGNALAVGSEIPLWHFDESQGLWIEDGVGHVVASSSSATGLAVAAEVSHFSTWNWDFKFNNPNTLSVKCVNSAGQPSACNVVATVLLEDGSHLTKNSNLSVEGSTIINLPTSGSVSWHATTIGGLIGDATSGVSGAVQITLSEPKTSNFVRCSTPDATYHACVVTLTADLGNNEIKTLNLDIPEEGALVQTNFNVSNISWSGTAKSVDVSGVHQLSGTATSNATANVNLLLDSDIIVAPVKQVMVRCVVAADYPYSVQPQSCNLRVYSNNEQLILEAGNVPMGQTVNVYLPVDTSVSNNALYAPFFINAFSEVNIDSELYYVDGYYSNYGDVVNNNKIIDIPIGYYPR
jgi:PKD repeat protein